MSYPYEKPPSEKHVNTSSSYASETDWAAIDAMEDEDIVINDECAEMLPSDFEKGMLRSKGRTPTYEEIEEGKRILFAYLNRPILPK